MIELSNVTAS